ncbi:ETEC_3214 domain-containing protein [Streptomyces filamentosus]|uniref:ETEC_3214 domain-containing protein n=1 Tax=Streptomyces filamentosus TaxID=67294 RepID=UPI0033DF5F85
MNWLLGNDWIGPLGDIGKIISGVVGAVAILKGVSEWWTNGPGRRRAWTKNFRLLGPGVRPAYVESLFGEPAFESKAEVDLRGYEEEFPLLTERVWKLGEDGYLVTWSSDLKVCAYSITTRDKGFKPKIRIGAEWGSNGTAVHVTLGRTRLRDIGAGTDWTPEEIATWAGARRMEYYETYYAGNVGHYTTWACGVSQAGHNPAGAGAVDRLGPEGNFDAFLPWAERDSLTTEQKDALDRFRAKATVNSLMVIAPGTPRIHPTLPRSGPDYDVVRTLIKDPGLFGKWKLRRELKKLERGKQQRRFARLRLDRGN